MGNSVGRNRNAFEITFRANELISSNIFDLSEGCYGTFIVPAGSPLITRQLQIWCDGRWAFDQLGSGLPEAALMSSPITLAPGANPLSADQVRQAGAAQYVTFRLNTAPLTEAKLWLLWKA